MSATVFHTRPHAGAAAAEERIREASAPAAAGPAPRPDGAAITGTCDAHYDLIWFVQACLQNALRLEGYIEDAARAQDEELEHLFRRAQAESRRGATVGKALLARRLADIP